MQGADRLHRLRRHILLLVQLSCQRLNLSLKRGRCSADSVEECRRNFLGHLGQLAFKARHFLPSFGCPLLPRVGSVITICWLPELSPEAKFKEKHTGIQDVPTAVGQAT